LLRLVLLGNDSEYRQGEQQTRFPWSTDDYKK
jgi:hypothetical protein